MEEDPRSSGIVAVTIMEEDEHEREEDEHEREKKAQLEREKKLAELDAGKQQIRLQPSLYEVSKRVVKEVLSDVDHIKKRLRKHSSDRQQVDRGGSSGFYKVPDDMRRRAGSKEAAGLLYDPKYVNFWKIRELFEKDDPDDDVQTLSQISHYYYHLHSYAERNGRGSDIEGLLWELCKEFELMVKLPTIDRTSLCDERVYPPDSLLGSPVVWGNIFLRDLFMYSFKGEPFATIDPECALLWVSELWADLLLLDNQIPLIKLDDDHDRSPDYESIFSYFADFIPLNKKRCRHLVWEFKTYRFYHILHLIHYLLLPTYYTTPRWVRKRRPFARFWRPREAAPSTMKLVPTATRLQQAGIKFKPVDEAGFVIEFKRGVLKLPRLHITKCTKKVLMNLIAWELCHKEATKYFINYAIFMDYLINTSKDVDILIQNGVFEHSLATDEEVASLFNGLSQDLIYTKIGEEFDMHDIFPQLSFDINNYCKSRRNLWLANLMQDYFKSPWSIISLIAALFIILLTLMQTFFSAYSYFRPPK